MKYKKPRKKKCKVCRETFQPERPMQPCCSIPCAIALGRKQAEKARKRAHREQKRKFEANDRRTQLRLAQAEFNRYIRLRDEGQPCISCGRHHQGQNHAGHYRSVGACPALRFEPLNVSLQCAPCNNHKSGNAIEYRINLIKKIGLDKVEWLEGPHEPKKYTAQEAIAIKEIYRAKCKALELKRDAS